MEKKMENDMETGIIIESRVKSLGLGRRVIGVI